MRNHKAEQGGKTLLHNNKTNKCDERFVLYTMCTYMNTSVYACGCVTTIWMIADSNSWDGCGGQLTLVGTR